jgi:hypothetical protein
MNTLSFRRLYLALVVTVPSRVLRGARVAPPGQGQPQGVPRRADARAPSAVSDGMGGEIVVSEEAYRGNVDLYIQRLNASGSPAMVRATASRCGPQPGDQAASPPSLSDVSGGAI